MGESRKNSVFCAVAAVMPVSRSVAINAREGVFLFIPIQPFNIYLFNFRVDRITYLRNQRCCRN